MYFITFVSFHYLRYFFSYFKWKDCTVYTFSLDTHHVIASRAELSYSWWLAQANSFSIQDGLNETCEDPALLSTRTID